MSDINEFHEWMNEICPNDGMLAAYIHPTSGQSNGDGSEVKESVVFYTDNYSYAITVHQRPEDEGYLGCVMSCRKSRAGETHTRGNDLPDGTLSRETWLKIKDAVIKNELVELNSKT